MFDQLLADGPVRLPSSRDIEAWDLVLGPLLPVLNSTNGLGEKAPVVRREYSVCRVIVCGCRAYSSYPTRLTKLQSVMGGPDWSIVRLIVHHTPQPSPIRNAVLEAVGIQDSDVEKGLKKLEKSKLGPLSDEEKNAAET